MGRVAYARTMGDFHTQYLATDQTKVGFTSRRDDKGMLGQYNIGGYSRGAPAALCQCKASIGIASDCNCDPNQGRVYGCVAHRQKCAASAGGATAKVMDPADASCEADENAESHDWVYDANKIAKVMRYLNGYCKVIDTYEMRDGDGWLIFFAGTFISSVLGRVLDLVFGVTAFRFPRQAEGRFELLKKISLVWAGLASCSWCGRFSNTGYMAREPSWSV
eukprot:COSAG01_NODE_4546_length_4932_cov_10.841092_2_plen_220_part_00